MQDNETVQTNGTETPQDVEQTTPEDAKAKKTKQLKKEISELTKKLETVSSELEELKTKYVALIAEYENFRKRSAKEKDDLFSSSVASVASSFLPLLDNLERALSYAPDDEGLKALKKQFDEIISKLGITEMQSDGAQFDPNKHNAIMHEEDSEKAENTVVQTFVKGYMLGERVVRHAMVKVVN